MRFNRFAVFSGEKFAENSKLDAKAKECNSLNLDESLITQALIRVKLN